MNNKLLWYGYLHTEGSVHAKRFFSERDIEEAEESPFVFRVTGIIEADNREEALKKICDEVGVVYNPRIHK